MIPEWDSTTWYRRGDAVWCHDIIWYCLPGHTANFLPDCGSKFWTSNKREVGL